eukprot:gene9755-10752_t
MNNSNTTSINKFQYTIQCNTLFTQRPFLVRNDLSPTNLMHFTIAAYINIVLAFPTAFFNLSLIITFIKLRLYKTVSNIPLIFLAAWDLLTSLFGQLLFGVYLIQMTKRQLNCSFVLEMKYSGIIVHIASSTIVLFITTERYLALFYVFFWTSHITRKHLAIPLSFAWAPGLLFDIFIIDIQHKVLGVLTYTSFTFISLIWITICCVKIFKYIRRMQKSVAAIEIDRESDKRKQARLSKYSTMIAAVYLIFHIPFSLMELGIHSRILGDKKTLARISTYMVTFSSLKSLVNPIVYAWQSPTIGKGMQELWRIRKPESGNNNTGQNGVSNAGQSSFQQ